MKYAASVRIDTRKREALPKGSKGADTQGNRIHVKIVKNKVHRPYLEADYDLYFDTGIDYAGALINAAVETGHVVKSGAYYTHASTGEKMGQGILKASQWLRDNEETYETLRGEVNGDATLEV